MHELFAYAVVGAGTYVMRSGFILAGAGADLPPAFKRTLRFVGPAVLSSLVAVDVANGEGISAALSGRPETFGILVAVGIAWWKSNVILTIAAGVAVVWVLQ